MRLSSKIFLILTGIFFLCGSLEVDIPSYDNTFFDAYDTYIHTDTDAGSVIAQQSNAVPVVLDFNELISALNLSAVQPGQPAIEPVEKHHDTHLLISLSVWRI